MRAPALWCCALCCLCKCRYPVPRVVTYSLQDTLFCCSGAQGTFAAFLCKYELFHGCNGFEAWLILFSLNLRGFKVGSVFIREMRCCAWGA